MSKRHQANRRKTYGRRQHELHERRQRDHVPDPRTRPASTTLGRRRHRRPLRVPRPAHAAPALRPGRLGGWPSTRARGSAPIVLPRRPRVEVGAAPPALPRRRTRSAVRARRGPSRISVLLAAIVVAFAGAFFSLSQDIRVSATGYELDRLADRSSSASTPRPRTSATSSTAWARRRRSASRRSTPASARCPSRSSSRPARTGTDRCSAGPTPAPARSCCSSSSWWWRAASACASRTGR